MKSVYRSVTKLLHTLSRSSTYNFTTGYYTTYYRNKLWVKFKVHVVKFSIYYFEWPTVSISYKLPFLKSKEINQIQETTAMKMVFLIFLKNVSTSYENRVPIDIARITVTHFVVNTCNCSVIHPAIQFSYTYYVITAKSPRKITTTTVDSYEVYSPILVSIYLVLQYFVFLSFNSCTVNIQHTLFSMHYQWNF